MDIFIARIICYFEVYSAIVFNSNTGLGNPHFVVERVLNCFDPTAVICCLGVDRNRMIGPFCRIAGNFHRRSNIVDIGYIQRFDTAGQTLFVAGAILKFNERFKEISAVGSQREVSGEFDPFAEHTAVCVVCLGIFCGIDRYSQLLYHGFKIGCNLKLRLLNDSGLQRFHIRTGNIAYLQFIAVHQIFCNIGIALDIKVIAIGNLQYILTVCCRCSFHKVACGIKLFDGQTFAGDGHIQNIGVNCIQQIIIGIAGIGHQTNISACCKNRGFVLNIVAAFAGVDTAGTGKVKTVNTGCPFGFKTHGIVGVFVRIYYDTEFRIVKFRKIYPRKRNHAIFTGCQDGGLFFAIISVNGVDQRSCYNRLGIRCNYPDGITFDTILKDGNVEPGFLGNGQVGKGCSITGKCSDIDNYFFDAVAVRIVEIIKGLISGILGRTCHISGQSAHCVEQCTPCSLTDTGSEIIQTAADSIGVLGHQRT